MTEANADFLRIRQDNLKTIQRELYRLKKQYEELFKDWLKSKGDYVTETRVCWFKFGEVARQYKELNFKVKGIAKGAEE